MLSVRECGLVEKVIREAFFAMGLGDSNEGRVARNNLRNFIDSLSHNDKQMLAAVMALGRCDGGVDLKSFPDYLREQQAYPESESVGNGRYLLEKGSNLPVYLQDGLDMLSKVKA